MCRVVAISPKDGRASQDSIGRGSRRISFFLHPPISLFSILSRDSSLKEAGVRVHQRRSNTENRVDVSSATRRNSHRNAIPSGIRRAYTSSRKRRKYCVATNKNMYRASSTRSSSPVLSPFRYAPIFSSPFEVRNGGAGTRKIRESNSSSESGPLLPTFFQRDS